jgi:glycosyltransferase involved in cell wall biosynthesis
LKLLYNLSEYLPDAGGGIITHYARVLPRLVQRGHSVKVLLASQEKLDHAAYVVDGVAVEPLQSSFYREYADRFERWEGLDIFRFMLPVAWAAWAQAQENFEYDVVETTDWALLFAPWVASKKRAPVVVSLHGSCGQVDWYKTLASQSLDGDLVRLAESQALRCADVVHANSRANAEFWRRQAGCEVTVISPAHDGEGAVDASGSGTHGLVVGRLQNWKGAELLCQALRLAHGVTVEWVGADTPWRDSGLMASEYLKRTYPDVFGQSLRWLGRLDREVVRRKVQEAKFLVVPSLWDVFNLTAAEGMEAGLPVICSRAAGAEMLMEDGRNGFLFDPEDPEALAERLREVAGLSVTQSNAVGSAARNSVLAALAPDQIVGLMEKSYQAAIAKGLRNPADLWCSSFFRPGERCPTPPRPGILRRAARKVRRVLTNV